MRGVGQGWLDAGAGAGLVKRGKPLKPGAPLKRTAMPPRRTRLRQVSDKRRREGPARRAVVERVVARDGATCSIATLVPEVGCWGPLDADERILRGQLKDAHLQDGNVRMICRAHHDWSHLNRIEAADRGIRPYPRGWMGARPGEDRPL